MSFVRSKYVKGKKYLWIVRNVRIEGRHVQQLLKYLGPGTERNLKEKHPLYADMISNYFSRERERAEESLLQGQVAIQKARKYIEEAQDSIEH